MTEQAATTSADYRFCPATRNAFVNDFISWRESVSDAPSDYAEALAIGVLAATAGRRLRVPIRQQPRPVPCNLFLCLLGPSTIARKSAALGAAEALLREVDGESLLEAPGSPEAFVQDLARHQDRGAVLIFDEFAWAFSAIKRRTHLSDLKGYLLRSYDNTPISRRLRDKRSGGVVIQDADIAHDPVLTILAASTPERLAMVSARDDVEDGFWPRWAIVWPQALPARRPLGPPDDASEYHLRAIVERLAGLRRRLADGGQAILSDDAWAEANNVTTEIEALAGEDLENGAIFGRAELRLLKVAALLALADDKRDSGNVLVEADHVTDAHRVVRRWLDDTHRFAELIGLNDFESTLTRALQALQRRRGRADRREIARVAHVTARDLQQIEQTLIDRGYIEVVDGGKGQRPTEWIATKEAQ